jgi:hypothetical protein
MNIKNTILNELESVAPALINVPKTVPYVLKDGYFDNLSTDILHKINSAKYITHSFSMDDNVVASPYTVPAYYFDSLANNILARLKIAEDHSYDSIIPIVVTNPYKVQSNYFNILSNQILEKIGFSQNIEFLLLDKVNRTTPYQIPFGYFDNFSSSVIEKLRNTDNQDVEVGINFIKTNPYKVPVGYFENLADQILFKVSPQAEGIVPKIGKDVPAGYFDTLPNIMLQKIRGLEVETELEQLAPILNSINKTPIHHVPTGYFDGLVPELPKKTGQTKVISIKKPMKWLKNAIAACLIGTLGFTAYQLMEISPNETTIDNSFVTQPTTANKEVITIPTANIDVDKELLKVDEASLAKYLDNLEMPTEQATAHFNDVNSGDVDKALQDIPNEAIQQHLEETGGTTK